MAQSTAGTSLLTTSLSTPRKVARAVYVDWNKDGDFSDSGEDITARVIQFTCSASLYDASYGLPALGSVSAGTATVTVANDDYWLSLTNAAGIVATYPALADGIYRIPIKIYLGYYSDADVAEALCQFTGEIEVADGTEGPSAATVTLSCHDVSLVMRQFKTSTAIVENQRADELIATYAALAGLTDVSLDESMSIIPVSWLNDENVWDELSDIALADGGLLYCDELGNLVFRRMTAWLEDSDSTTSQATLTRGRVWTERTSQSWRDCYTDVIVEYAPYYEGAVTTVYQAQAPITVPPNRAITETYQLDNPCASVITPVAATDYQAASAAGLDLAANLTVTVTAKAQRVDVTFTNNNAYHAIYVYKFQIRGRPLYGIADQEVKETTALTIIPDNKTYTINNNRHIQSKAQATRLAGSRRDWLQRPRRIYKYEGPLLPWLQLGDRVTAQNASAGLDEDCFILAKTVGYAPNDMASMELTLLPVTNLYAYAAYFLIGTTAYNTSTTPIFY